ncbi:hypothetical protein BDN72DRAFT_865889 [Pluteus cervinus]|uniref:Uncharacterized protein n=1 Tax=Pluteus cervinus TaxID=181527 RepID=A0ACD2ZYE9_9AGAR|nr:hypothetical protein BDN72DRAFT_865889 [Pluteus cervinus]
MPKNQDLTSNKSNQEGGDDENNEIEFEQIRAVKQGLIPGEVKAGEALLLPSSIYMLYSQDNTSTIYNGSSITKGNQDNEGNTKVDNSMKEATPSKPITGQEWWTLETGLPVKDLATSHQGGAQHGAGSMDGKNKAARMVEPWKEDDRQKQK